MIGVFWRPLIYSRGGKRTINATFQLFAKFFHPPVFDEKCQPRFSAQLARAVVAEYQDDMAADGRRFFSVTNKFRGVAIR